MHDITSRWIPPNERSRFMSAYMGGSIGIALCYPIFGFIISISSWEWIFHFCTVITVVWFIVWQYCVYDSPDQHPRIEPSELNYITNALGNSSQKDKNVTDHITTRRSTNLKTKFASRLRYHGYRF